MGFQGSRRKKVEKQIKPQTKKKKTKKGRWWRVFLLLGKRKNTRGLTELLGERRGEVSGLRTGAKRTNKEGGESGVFAAEREAAEE